MRESGGRRSLFGREHEGTEVIELNLLHKIEERVELAFFFPGEADDQGGTQADAREKGSNLS